MATARVLPSGRWRCLVFDGMENGKRKYKSFTAATKNDAELQAKQYLSDPTRKQSKDTITVKDAIERYITVKTGVLSPATIRGYRQMQRTRFSTIENEDIFTLNTEKMQKFVSSTTMNASAKTTANAYGLLTASVAMFRPDAIFRVTMPKKAAKRKSAPSDGDVQTLYKEADGELKLCIALAAFGSMRRGEICALKYSDIEGNAIYIHKDMVMDENNHFQIKNMPKTSDSVRIVQLPDSIIKMIGTGKPENFIVNLTPSAITIAFMRLRDRLGINIRFHDLRHYYASIGAVLNIPDNYVADFGGWRRGSSVMKEIYQGVIQDAKSQYAAMLNKHFECLLSDKKSENATQNATRKIKTPVNTGALTSR